MCGGNSCEMMCGGTPGELAGQLPPSRTEDGERYLPVEWLHGPDSRDAGTYSGDLSKAMRTSSLFVCLPSRAILYPSFLFPDLVALAADHMVRTARKRALPSATL